MNRKALFIIFAIVLPVLPGAGAQKHPGFRYVTLDAGITMAGIRSSSGYDNHARNLGARLGMAGNYSLSDRVSAEGAFLFEQKGAADPVYDITTNLNYLTLPVTLKFTAGKDPQLFFALGVYISRLLSASRKGESFYNGIASQVREKVTPEFKPLDAGLIFSGGMMIRLYDDFDFIISAGISGGVLTIDNDPGHNPRNYNICISVGYIYYMGYR